MKSKPTAKYPYFSFHGLPEGKKQICAYKYNQLLISITKSCAMTFIFISVFQLGFLDARILTDNGASYTI